jgi:glycosyltransferase involved in cell wall biosynthesis
MNVLVAGAFEASCHWAHAINTVKMAQGFASLGHRVTMVCRRPPQGRVDEAQLSASYGLGEPIRWIQLPRRILARRVGENWGFSALALLAALPARPHLVYARSYIFPWMSSRCGIPTVVESHAHPDNSSKPFLRLVDATRHRAFRLWVTISTHLSDHYQSLGVPAERLAVLPDAVDLGIFKRPHALPPSPYPTGKPVVAYVGHLYDYKGIPTVLEAASRLPDLRFHLVGGWPQDVAANAERIRRRGLTNVTLHGLKPHAEIPPYLWHADLLLLPPSADHPSAAWTSPLKLGEYLASGTPVVATSIPALRDLVVGTEVRFVEPDSPDSLAEGIAHVLGDSEYAASLSRDGSAKAEGLSYVRRAEAVLERIGL